MTAADIENRSELLAGPLLRRVEPRLILLWLATARQVHIRIELILHDGRVLWPRLIHRDVMAGARLHLGLLQIELDEDLPIGRWTGYRVVAAYAGECSVSLDTPVYNDFN